MARPRTIAFSMRRGEVLHLVVKPSGKNSKPKTLTISLDRVKTNVGAYILLSTDMIVEKMLREEHIVDTACDMQEVDMSWDDDAFDDAFEREPSHDSDSHYPGT